MFLYLTKRVFLMLPSLWLIATLVFLLSRLLPGAFGIENMLQESSSFYSAGQAEAREAAYASFLHKTGQDLPLFYFSLHAAAEPDTLSSLPPGQDQKLLKKISWTYGNKGAVLAYFNSLKELEQELMLKDEKIPPHLRSGLYTSSAPDEIAAAVGALDEKYGDTATSGMLKLQEAAAELTRKRQLYRILLPAIQWHGALNQYHQWLLQILQGNFGVSFRDNRPVVGIIADAIKTTLPVLLISMVVTALLAIELSVFMLTKRGRRWRKLFLPLLFLTDRIPVFLLALLFLILFASPDYLQIFPVYGLGYHTSADTNGLQRLLMMAPYLVLPVICLVTVNLPYITNQFYRAMLDISQAEYVKTARAKGLAEGAIVRKHILRNALLPLITLLTDFIPALVAGAVVIETIFAIPGIGSLLVQAVQSRDYPVLVGIVTIVALTKIFSHLVADILYSLADPRLRPGMS